MKKFEQILKAKYKSRKMVNGKWVYDYGDKEGKKGKIETEDIHGLQKFEDKLNKIIKERTAHRKKLIEEGSSSDAFLYNQDTTNFYRAKKKTITEYKDRKESLNRAIKNGDEDLKMKHERALKRLKRTIESFL